MDLYDSVVKLDYAGLIFSTHWEFSMGAAIQQETTSSLLSTELCKLQTCKEGEADEHYLSRVSGPPFNYTCIFTNRE